MNVWSLSWRYLWSRPLTTVLNLLLLTLGLAVMAFLLQMQDRLSHAFDRDLAGIDLVVGAKGSPMQLILAGVFHIDAPPGNIPLAEAQALASHPQVAEWMPLSLGDSFQGYRIVGTEHSYPRHYGAALAQGNWWAAPLQAVLGAQVARTTGLVLGAAFAGSHGLGAGDHAHAENPYRVTGVLAPCGCVLDRLVLTDTASVWKVHEDMYAGDAPLDAEDRQALVAERELTMLLIRYNTPLAAASFPRYVNSSTSMQAASPAAEVSRLLAMVGVGTEVLRGLGAVLLLVAALSVFIALWGAVRERRADLAMLRMLGTPASKVVALLLCESLWLALLATLGGFLLAHGLTSVLGSTWMVGDALATTGWHWSPAQAWVPLTAVGVALMAAALPALGAYRVDVMSLLQTR